MLGTLGGASSVARGINNAGQVVGDSDVTVNGSSGVCAFRTAPNAAINPQTDNLQVGCGGSSYDLGFAINDSGQAAGLVQTSNTTGYYLGFRTAPNQLINVTTDLLGSGQDMNAIKGLNSSGQAVGMFGYASCSAFRTAPNANISLATDNLGSLGAGCTYPTAINDSGQVVGYSYSSSNVVHAFRTAPDVAINPATDDLGVMPPYGNSLATSINAAGTAVGLVSTSQNAFDPYYPSPTRAVIWQSPSGMKDLNQLVDPSSGWLLFQANGVNNNGQVVGVGCINNEQRAYLLTPAR
jgi:probable HAF family extracellular repeat protein